MFHASCKNAPTLAPPAQLLMAHCQKWSRADHSALTMNFNWRHSSRVIKILRLEAGRCTVSSLCVWPWPLGLIVARQDLVQWTEAILKYILKDPFLWLLRLTLIVATWEPEEMEGQRVDGAGERRIEKEIEISYSNISLIIFLKFKNSGPQNPISESLFGLIQMTSKPNKLCRPVAGLCVWPW